MPALPQHCPTARELDDLELLVGGAFAPIVVFNEPGSPVTLTLPPAVQAQAEVEGGVELVDPEGLPLARVVIPAGTIEPLTHAQYGPFRRLYLTPAEARSRYAGRTFVPLVDALTDPQLTALGSVGPLVLLPLVGHGTPELSATGLIRATLAAADLLPDAAVVAIPLASHGDAETDHALGVQVVANYAGPDPVTAPLDGRAAAPLAGRASAPLAGRVASASERIETPPLVGRVASASERIETYPPTIQAIVDRERPAPADQGLVLFFTGLSGSGKSTLARALMDRVLEQGVRTLTSLDGDVVRRNLSAGLTFSKEDRETNIRRIGWVAAEIARHGGVAVCSPIAPFDETRQQVRAMVEEAGGAFFLVHVATPLEECERRDRKGLYAKARRGEIPEFTGISSPYDEPADADVRVDTTDRTIDEALDDVLVALQDAGYLDLTAPTEVEAPVVSTSSTDEASSTVRVLFVCTANICRSPYMEISARHLAGPGAAVTFASAGTHGFTDHALDEEMSAVLGVRGADGSAAFRSRAFSPDLLAEADLVLTAEAAHRTFIIDSHPEAFRKVFTLGQFARAVRGVDPGLSGRDLVAAAARSRGPADAELDVTDPYRKGPAAAAAAADRIDDLLRVVVPALTGQRMITP